MLQPPGFAVAPDVQTLRADVQRWLSAEPLRELVALFDGPEPGQAPDELDKLAEWSARHWDFRAGRERNLVDPGVVDAGLEQQVVTAAERLGMVQSRAPLREEYDHVLMLGGLVRACVWRPEYAAWLLSHGVKAGAVAVITGFRALNDNEHGLLSAFGMEDLTHEHEVMERTLRRAFGVTDLEPVSESAADTEPNLRSLVERGVTAEGVPVSMVVAPSRDPGRRANTPDGYEYWAREVAHVRPGDRVLMVTSSIYVPFQHTDAVRTLGLPHGCVLETVGIDADAIDDRGQPQVFRGVNYLQEVNSMLRSLNALSVALG